MLVPLSMSNQAELLLQISRLLLDVVANEFERNRRWTIVPRRFNELAVVSVICTEHTRSCVCTGYPLARFPRVPWRMKSYKGLDASFDPQSLGEPMSAVPACGVLNSLEAFPGSGNDTRAG